MFAGTWDRSSGKTVHRYEYKYLVPFTQADDIREAVAPFTLMDPYTEKGAKDYTIRSIYFDRARFHNYVEKKEGLKNRRKLRIRGYNLGGPDSQVFLEIKRRLGVPVLKARAPLTLSDVPDFLASGNIDQYIRTGNHPEKRIADARSFLYYYHRYAMRPTVKVIYEREAHIGRFDRSVRVTLDKNLRGELFPNLESLFQENNVRHVFKDHFILEIKFTGMPMPVWGRSLVERMEGKWRALSKYTLCLDVFSARVHRLNAAVRGNTVHPFPPAATNGNSRAVKTV